MTTNPSSPHEALAHTLATFADKPDSGMAVVATRNVPVRGAVTGLTWGDLRALAADLACRPAVPAMGPGEALRDAASRIERRARQLDGRWLLTSQVCGVLHRLADDAEAGESR